MVFNHFHVYIALYCASPLLHLSAFCVLVSFSALFASQFCCTSTHYLYGGLALLHILPYARHCICWYAILQFLQCCVFLFCSVLVCPNMCCCGSVLTSFCLSCQTLYCHLDHLAWCLESLCFYALHP